MICFLPKQSVKERLASRFHAAAMRLNRYEHLINLWQALRIIKSQNPATIGFAIQVKNAQIQWLSSPRLHSPPGLESAGIFEIRLTIKVEGIK